ncbi:Alpha-L-rhamnosidase N-terminal domain-containing protein [Micromonospora rhizosphaerae]|uniref:alpha-L-rhamnosidase n=1 Tax=Micromonospora rhizosphaerae TaxID=568872 RepID=A0A1C6SA85_9ACTN|nr:family 78 glycoside hydrolase catalytic domain [Micromonospora rhizosphaerae]SCL26379.1 Alpha-L-rhamnosidase N-terminal domain-containing protein [Micromonospora rhizosphaerae]
MSPSMDRRRFIQLGVAGGAAAALGGLDLLRSPAAVAQAPADVPSGLLTALLDDPLGIVDPHPRLSWIVPADGPRATQTAYQVQVARTRDRLLEEDLVWDSGRVASADSTAVPLGGPPLESRGAYWWRVRTWTTGNLPSGWSPPQRIVTGIGPEWAAIPVWAPAPPPPPVLGDGRFAVTTVIKEKSAGLVFRAADLRNNYLWQLIAGPTGVLKTHVQVNGAYRVLAEHPIGRAVPLGTPIPVEIELAGTRIRTYLDGQLVDTTEDPTYASGTVGFRNGGSESQTYDDVTFTGPSGTVLLAEGFSHGPGAFPGGTVQNGALAVARGQQLLAGPAPDHWAALRTEVRLADKPIESAILYLTGQSPDPIRQYVYSAWVNGGFVGSGPTRAPAGEPRYHSYEVTALLRPGEANALAALCYTPADQRFLAQMEVRYADGSRLTVGTGADWRARSGGRWLPAAGDLRGGYYTAPQEFIDAREEPVGWLSPGFDDSSWTPAAERAPIDGLLPAQTPNLRREAVTPAAVRRVGDGRWIVDLGREIVGGLALDLDGAYAGRTVEIRLGEELSGPDTVRYQLRGGNVYREVWTLRDGTQHLEHWGYRGFRYAELITDPALDLSSAVRGVAIRLPWRADDAAFRCSDDDLNRVWEMCRYSIEATRLDLYQDTPTRERGPYEGDAYVNQLSEYATQRSYALARWSNSYLARRPTWPSDYRLMSVLSAWLDYLHTGDPDQLARDWSLYVEKNFDEFLAEDGLLHKPTSVGGVSDLVDWPVSNRDGYVLTTVNTVVNAFQCAAFAACAEVARVLGKAEEERRFADLAGRLRQAVNEQLIDRPAAAYRDGLSTAHRAQHATAFPIALGVADDADLPALAATLASGGMRMSVYGAQFLLDALYRGGRGDTGYALMTSHARESWLHLMDDLGATIVGEAWDPALKPNMTFSHAWGSAPANVVMRRLLGVTVTAPGAAQVDVRPQPGPLEWAEGRVPTIRGPVGVRVDRRDGYRLDVDLPPNVHGRILVPLDGSPPQAFHVIGPGPHPERTVVDGHLVLSGVAPGPTTVILDQRPQPAAAG